MKKVIAFLLALVLTGTLVLFCVSFLARQIIRPAMNEGGAQASDTVIRSEQQLVRERVSALAELYRFDPEPVLNAINEETLRGLNSQASRWWSTLLRDGKTGDELRWDAAELDEALEQDASLNGMEDQDRAEYLRIAAAEEVRKSVTRLVLPMRQQIIRLGMKEIGKRVDLPNLITFFLGVPWAALALSALLAGLIYLLESRKFRGSVLYIGYALGGAALVLVFLIILYLNAGILQMIREASESLAVQYQNVVSGTMIRAGILAAAMAAGCVLCLLRSRKDGTPA